MDTPTGGSGGAPAVRLRRPLQTTGGKITSPSCLVSAEAQRKAADRLWNRFIA